MYRISLPFLLVFAAIGCGDSNSGPVAITPEIEAKLKAEEEAANEEEQNMPRENGSPAAKIKPRAKK